ncbi:Phospholipase D1 [Agyrium rufum]|nr:Phospholipase D1 [Agyrium rufum]
MATSTVSALRTAPGDPSYVLPKQSTEPTVNDPDGDSFPFNIPDFQTFQPRPLESDEEPGKESRGDALVDHGIKGGIIRQPTSPIISPRLPGTPGSPSTAGRRSVQFARSGSLSQLQIDSQDHSDPISHEGTSKEHRASLFARLRAFGSGSSTSGNLTRKPSSNTVGGDLAEDHLNTGIFSPDPESGPDHTLDSSDEEGAVLDDEGDNVDDGQGRHAGRRSKRRKSRRPSDGGVQTAPTTPKTPFMRDGRPNIFQSSSGLSHTSFRPNFLTRRATVADGGATDGDDRQGVSEDEGRERLARASPWRRGSAFVYKNRGHNDRSNQTHSEGLARPTTFRRLTGFGVNEHSDGLPASPWKLRGERAQTVSAARWRQLKAGFKLIGKSRKPENTVDHVKSAELMAELTAGIPAALILASMFQRDEHQKRRIPILLEQLKVHIADTKHEVKSGDRHLICKIEMEYGSGMTRMKWTIHRTLRDFANLHTRYKLALGTKRYIQLKGKDDRTKLPHFPRSAFPYLRGVRGVDVASDSEDETIANTEANIDATRATGEGSGIQTPVPMPATSRKKSSQAMSFSRRKSSTSGLAANGAVSSMITAAGVVAGASASVPARKEAFAAKQRRTLEQYLQQMIRYLIFRPESNRLCRFLELSALGVRLAAEGSYHGKEGFLTIVSGKGIDFRRAWTPTYIQERHKPKWFLVRHSYVVCVDSPEEMNIYDVFLVDSSFQIQAKQKGVPFKEKKAKDLAKSATESAKHPQHHRLKLVNSERKIRLIARNERLIEQFEESIRYMHSNTPWAHPNRFDSFAPARQNVFAQWLVDGRDYMWNVSRAISMARDVIYIHDWWLSPELYMRRPAAISQKWRLDRLLQRKAREGVKIFIIIYRNINSAIPIDSEYTKFSLLDLHPNVFVQRSPNQIRQATFFWAHHEKICVVDHMVAFVGGIDLCFGRWDTPQHTVADDKLTGFELSDMPKDADHCQLWPGKDYSNPRVQDFYSLDKPYEEMYDRSKVPRMPWHDISMQVVGQPARDLTRHFVQRWNYILRQRKPTRPTPFLLPPPDFVPDDLKALGLDGTCEVQILRSAAMWSIGTPRRVEHSIMNAYLKMIEESEHFVYIENQFFISSTEVDGTKMENNIGDALVERAIRAYENDEDWRAVILIPLMPGFQNTVDQPDGSSVRLIMQCQFRSICRTENSIFGRLRAAGIEPEDYIQFYSLRSWGRIGPNKQLVTEQLYIHAKCMVVDDRIAIIGSANINERSMLGDRDSECAAVVRDSDMISSTMNGEPYEVGRFPHTLRMRLMREHLGIDVDAVMEGEQNEQSQLDAQNFERDMDRFHGEGEEEAQVSQDQQNAPGATKTRQELQAEIMARSETMHSFNHDVDWEQPANPNAYLDLAPTKDARVTENSTHRNDVRGDGADHMSELDPTGLTQGRDSALTLGSREVLIAPKAADKISNVNTENKHHSPVRPSSGSGVNDLPLPPPPKFDRMSSAAMGFPVISSLPPLPAIDDTDIGGPAIQQAYTKQESELVAAVLADMKRPVVEQDCMRDPLIDAFHLDIWHTVAENNTKIFRSVFRCMPDNEVKTWTEYSEYTAYAERFSQAQGGGKSKDRIAQEAQGKSGPPGQGSAPEKLRTLGASGEKGESRAGAGTSSSLIDRVKSSDSKFPNPGMSMAKVEDWAINANRQQDERAGKDGLKNNGSAGDTLDEKAAMREAESNGTVNERPVSGNLDRERTIRIHTPEGNGVLLEKQPLNEKASSDKRPRSGTAATNTQRRRRRATTRGSRREFLASDDMMDPKEAGEVLKNIQGSLVVWPYNWLEREEEGSNWLFSLDGLAPLEI